MKRTETEKKRWRERYDVRKVTGMCTVHGKLLAVDGKTRCQMCVDRVEKRKSVARVLGFCVAHNTVRAMSGKVICHICSDQERDRRKVRKSNSNCQVHPKRGAVFGRTVCQACLDYNRIQAGRLKHAVFAHYGEKCACTGCSNPFPGLDFLTIDHINNDGAAHRKQIGNSIYAWLKKNKFPGDFQTLCWNCNMAKSRHGGVCPHLVQR